MLNSLKDKYMMEVKNNKNALLGPFKSSVHLLEVFSCLHLEHFI